MTTDVVVALSSAQRQRLQALIRAPDTAPRVRLRATIVLMSARGTGGEEIAQTLGITRRTVTNIRARWRAQGLRGLSDRPHPGRPPSADVGDREGCEALGEDPANTAVRGAAEAADFDAHADWHPLRREIGQRAPVATLHARAELVAEGAPHLAPHGAHFENEGAIVSDDDAHRL